MKILFFGDVVARSGREALEARLPQLLRALSPDMVIVNGENAAHGFGITEKICAGFYALGVDCITTGNHIWSQPDIVRTIDSHPNLLRPANFPEGTPGNGHYLHRLPDGREVLVLNVMGRLYMDALDDPFAVARKIVEKHVLGRTVSAIFVDIHGEASSEKEAMGHMLDGKVSAVVGTHTHVPTADARILPGGTAFQTDAGMCGDYDSVIGRRKEAALTRFTKKMALEKLTPADGPGTLCGVLVETDDSTGLARRIAPVIDGPHLRNTPDCMDL